MGILLGFYHWPRYTDFGLVLKDKEGSIWFKKFQKDKRSRSKGARVDQESKIVKSFKVPKRFKKVLEY